MCTIDSHVSHPDYTPDGSTMRHDIALITYTDKNCHHLHALPSFRGKLREGQEAYVSGHPRGMRWSFTTGTVSDADETFVKLDTVAGPGNSGGPAVDKKGRVIGLVFAIVADPIVRGWGGDTFLIPIQEVLEFACTNDLCPR
jgi:S1-C subfamily serine protease